MSTPPLKDVRPEREICDDSSGEIESQERVKVTWVGSITELGARRLLAALSEHLKRS